VTAGNVDDPERTANRVQRQSPSGAMILTP
jgi:hypothetical protein